MENRIDGTNLVSHRTQQQALVDLFSNGRMPHSMMFVGPSGIGKSILARNLAQLIVCQNADKQSSVSGCGECKNCTLVTTNSYPDLYMIDCANREEASVGAIRELLGSIQLKSFSGSARVVIFNNCDSLRVEPSNALLKTLEEPLANTFFILIVENPAKLPATILSRCQRWFFGALSDSEMEQILKRNNTFSEEERSHLIKLSGGTLSGITELSQNLELYQDIDTSFQAILKGNLKVATDLATQIHKDKELCDLYFRILLVIARDVMIRSENAHVSQTLALYINDLIKARSYIKERNLNSFYVMQVVFQNLFLRLKGQSLKATELSEVLI